MQNRPIIVQKFGGTSVGTSERLRHVSAIVRNSNQDNQVVVVLSAMSGSTKASGTTSRLLQAAADAVSSNGADFRKTIEAIQEEHVKSARDAIQSEEEYQQAHAEIVQECTKLRSFLDATQVIGEMSPRSKDVVIGTGEKLSCILFTAVLKSQGVPAVYVNLERVIQKDFSASELDHQFYSYLRSAIAEQLQPLIDQGDVIPIVTGYFGFVPNGIVNTVGRGYTDFTASLIAAGLHASELQIWKEVDGIFTADPSKVPTAKLLKQISPAEAAELTFYGSEVIHPFTMQQAINARIPIRIKNTFKPMNDGTVIQPDESNDVSDIDDLGNLDHYDTNGDTSLPRKRLKSASVADIDSSRHPTAVTVKNNVIVVNVRSNRKSLAHDFLERIFALLNRHGITVDMISTSEVLISMALASIKDKDVPMVMKELRALGKVTLSLNMAIVSLVGKQMRNMVGIAGKMFTALAEAHVNIEMISQGASEINISCVVEQGSAERAIRAIHDQLIVPVPT